MTSLRQALPAQLCGGLVIGCCLLGCRSAPITGRPQLLMVPEQSEISMGATAYQETLSTHSASTNAQYIEVVQRVGSRISQVANRPDYQWEFTVLASPEMNAFCLPGGKVAVHEGIMPICQNEAGVAVVLSHEIAHALARHGGERMSQSYVVNGVGTAVGYMTRSQDAVLRQRINTVYGLSSKYGFILPYSRKHESEADHMGLLLMAQAGYDPSEAPRFWTRFGGQQSAKPPEFLSTHPADDRRAHELQELLPQAVAMYEQAPQKLGLGETLSVAPIAQQPAPVAPDGTALPGEPATETAAAGAPADGTPAPVIDGNSQLARLPVATGQ